MNTHGKLYILTTVLALLASIVFVASCHSSPENVFVSNPSVLYKVTDTSKQISPLFGLLPPR